MSEKIFSEVEIGDYRIVTLPQGKVWLQRLNPPDRAGEGMECSEELLNKTLDQFFEDNF